MKQGIDYIGLGVGAFIQRPDGKIFAAKRGKSARNEVGMWEFPGGGVEFGEPVTEALVREVYEEYGIEVEVGKLLGYVDFILPEGSQHWVGLQYVCHHRAGEGEIREPEFCDETGWFSIEQLEALPLSTLTRATLKNLQRNN